MAASARDTAGERIGTDATRRRTPSPTPRGRYRVVHALAAQAGNAALGRLLARRMRDRGGAPRLLQRRKIVNLASGTRPETLMRPATADDVVINVDSGHMIVAEILRERPTSWFEQMKLEPDLKIKATALDARTKKSAAAMWHGGAESEAEQLGMDPRSMGLMIGAVNREAYEKELRDFVIRALFDLERFRGAKGLERLAKEVLGKAEASELDARIKTLETSKDVRFMRGFVETLAQQLPEGDADEVHVISALGFDLINDRDAVRSVWMVLKKGGRLFITSERTGMVSKAIATTGKGREQAPVVDKDGKPVLKPDLAISKEFQYLPAESAYGQGVFKEAYPQMKTQHTTGDDAFEAGVPFARLVFVKP
jgi:hypothetical protein